MYSNQIYNIGINFIEVLVGLSLDDDNRREC